MVNSYHQPVLRAEVIRYLSPRDGESYLDATFGAGGYSQAILQNANCFLYALDRDISVQKFTYRITEKYGSSFKFINERFGNLKEVALSHNINDLDGIVFDIGVSSMQIDTPERGFSFYKDGALDMRMDPSSRMTAYDIINYYSEQELADIFFTLGGERKSRKIASAIIEARKLNPIATTLQLADLIINSVGRYRDGIHPATRTFQALRIVVDDELDELKQGLKAAAELLKIGGKLIVVTFHSLEDKIVKEFFTKLVGKPRHYNRYAPLVPSNPEASSFELLTKKVIVPTDHEIKGNIRARSAKLRALRRIR